MFRISDISWLGIVLLQSSFVSKLRKMGKHKSVISDGNSIETDLARYLEMVAILVMFFCTPAHFEHFKVLSKHNFI